VVGNDISWAFGKRCILELDKYPGGDNVSFKKNFQIPGMDLNVFSSLMSRNGDRVFGIYAVETIVLSASARDIIRGGDKEVTGIEVIRGSEGTLDNEVGDTELTNE
jgi:hypothetical protein